MLPNIATAVAGLFLFACAKSEPKNTPQMLALSRQLPMLVIDSNVTFSHSTS
ncbi:MAG: hypothetical protein ACI810_001494, partial [Gammaproteobacteria bacterium]